MLEKNICPGCGRHCDLSEPHCSRGAEYLRTGKMPERQTDREHNHEMRMANYRAKDINDKLIMNLRDLSHMMRSQYEGKASQKRILIIVNESETITQRDLTEHLRIQPGSASEILTKLENAGLIIRTQNETDRRTMDIRLTDAGRELAEEASAQRQKRHEEMFSSLSEEEKQQLLLLLEKLYTDWRARHFINESPHEHGKHHHEHHGHHENHEYHGNHEHHENHEYHGNHEHHENHEYHGNHEHHENHEYHGNHERHGHHENHEYHGNHERHGHHENQEYHGNHEHHEHHEGDGRHDDLNGRGGI